MESYKKNAELKKEDLIKALEIAIDTERKNAERFYIYKDTKNMIIWKNVINELKCGNSINII